MRLCLEEGLFYITVIYCGRWEVGLRGARVSDVDARGLGNVLHSGGSSELLGDSEKSL